MSSSDSSFLIGQVKWFNNSSGYGFITCADKTDVFVHHSAIKVNTDQYKYLVQGEYVSFQISTTENGAHATQASNVSGVNGGSLMCEIRRSTQTQRAPTSVTPAPAPEQVVAPVSSRNGGDSGRGRGSRGSARGGRGGARGGRGRSQTQPK
jgi:CspA family cold shock protein